MASDIPPCSLENKLASVKIRVQAALGDIYLKELSCDGSFQIDQGGTKVVLGSIEA